jgi:DNA repair protein RadC
MTERSAPSPEVHIIREVHLSYGAEHRLQTSFRDSVDVAQFLRRVIVESTREHAVGIYLDSKNRPLGWRMISIGTDVMAPVKPVLALQPAVMLGANSMIFAHNHPSGDLQPSPEDIELARRLCEACELLGLRLLDNVIWSDTGSLSYRPYAR